MRCFISLNVPENIKKEIVKMQDSLPEFNGKITERENLHLTLKFLGEIDGEKAEKIRQKLKEIKFRKFESEIDKMGIFDEDFIRIIWVHLTNCDELQKIIDRKLKKMFITEKRFMGHLTIARVKSIKDKKKFLNELKKIEFPKIKFAVDRFYLMKSKLTAEGPKYEIIEEYGLD